MSSSSRCRTASSGSPWRRRSARPLSSSSATIPLNRPKSVNIALVVASNSTIGTDQPGHLHRVQVQVVAELLLDRELGPRPVELDLPAGVTLRGQVAQQQV